MKVLMLGWELPPHHTGGLGVVCYQMCQQMALDGIDIEFILPFTAQFDVPFMKVTAAHPQSPSEVLKNASAYAHSSPTSANYQLTPAMHNVIAQQKRYEEGVAKIVPYKEFDILHAHDWLTFKAAIAAKQLTGKPLIAHIHATEYDRSGGGYGNPFIRDIEQHGLMLADQVVAVSQATKDTIVREYGIPASKIEVAHNAFTVEPTHIDELSTTYSYLEYMKSQGYTVVLSAGRLTLQKGLTFFLRAAKEVVARDDKILFLIVGGGEQYEELIDLSAEYGIAKNVLFSGYLNGTGKQWRDAFRVADLFVMPSVSEPFGITPLEAISYGTPVLISKQSGISEVLNNALKVDFWDVTALANKIHAVVHSPALQSSLYDNAKHEYEKLTWSHATQKIVDIYQRKLSGAIS